MKKLKLYRLSAALLSVIIVLICVVACAKSEEPNVGTFETDVYTPVETAEVPEYEKYDTLMTAFTNNGETPAECFEFTEDGDHITVVGLHNSDIVVVIPAEINGKIVKKIAANAFENNTLIKAVCFPETVEEIGDGALKGCTSVTTLKMPLNTVGDGVFPRIFGADGYADNPAYMPASLETLIFTGNQADVPGYCFFECNHLKNVIFPDGVVNIGKFAFFGCSDLEYIHLPGSLQTIGEYTFARCSSIQTIKLPESVTSVGLGAYEDCLSVLTLESPIFGGGDKAPWLGYIFGAEEYSWNKGYVPTALQSVKITGQLSEVPLNAFFECPYIVDIKLPESVKSVSVRAFYGCRGLTSVELPAGCEKIGDEAFYKCVGLKEIESEAIKEVGMQSFYGCISLESVDFANAEKIGNSAFCGCTVLTEFNVGKASVGDDALKNTKIN